MNDHLEQTLFSGDLPPGVMAELTGFLQGILASLPVHLAILDEHGVILMVNRAWREFAEANGLNDPRWCVGKSYFAVCDAATGVDSDLAHAACDGLRQVLSDAHSTFTLEYPCHSPQQQRWFLMRASSFHLSGRRYCVVLHEDITQRVLAEEQARLLVEFPGENPNPVLRIARNGEVLYANEASAPLLEAWGLDENGKVLQTWREQLQSALEVDHVTRLKVDSGGRNYLFDVAPIRRSGSVNVYGYDVTAEKRAEDQLRKLSLAVEQSPSVVVITDLKGRIEYANPRFTELTGYTLEEAVGQNPSILKTGHTSAEEYNWLWRTIHEGGTWRGEFLNRKKNGDLFWETSVICGVKDANGQITHFVAIKEEITERKRAEEALRQSEAKAQAVLTALPDLMFMVSRDGTFVDYKAPETIPLYVPRDQIIGRRISDIMPESLADELSECVERTLDTGVVQVYEYTLPLGQQTNVYEARFAKSGENEVVSLVRDITERKSAEEALAASEARFRAVFERSSLGQVMTAPDGRLLKVNQAFADLLGYTIEDLQQIDFMQITHPSDVAYSQEVARALLVNEQSQFRIEKRYIHRNGKILWTDVNSTLLRDSAGSPLYFITSVADISERKQAEAHIRRLNRTLSVLSDVNQAIVHLHALPALYETACNIAVEKGAFRMAWVGLYDAERRMVIPAAHAGVTEDYLDNIDIRLDDEARGRGPVATAARTGQHVVLKDIENDSLMAPWRENALRLGYRATAVFPLKVSGEVRGTFALYSSELDFFDDEELRLLDEMAADLSFAMEFAEQETQRRHAEESLHASEAQYRSLIESTDSVIATFNSSGVLLYANQIAAAAVHLPIDQLIGKHLREMFPAPVARSQLAAVRQVIRTGVGIVNTAPTPVLGEERWYRNSVQPIWDAAGQVSAALVNATDITDFKRAEAALQQAHATLEEKVTERTAELNRAKLRLEAILDNTTDGVVLVSLEHGIEQTNTMFRTLFACEPDGYFGQKLLALVQADERDRLAALIQAVVGDGIGRHDEFRAVRADNTIFEARIGIGYVQASDILGAGLVCSVGDIGVMKQRELLLRETQQMLQNVLETMPVRVFWKDRSSTYLGCNYLYMQDNGFTSSEQLVGKSDFDLASREHAAGYQADDRAVMESGISRVQIEEQVILADGSTIWVQTNKSPLKDAHGATVGVIGAYVDITKLKQAEGELRRALEQQKELVDLKAHFISMASHDFRTPLSVILSSTSLLEMQIRRQFGADQVEPLQKRFSRIADAIWQMTNLLDDVLTVNRTDTGKIEVHVEPVDVESFCEEILQEIQVSASASHILTLSFTGSDNRVQSDRHILRQILVNLLSNAVKYSPDGGHVLLDVRCEPQTLEFRVQDEGIGIPEQDQTRLFETFHRAQNVGDIRGTGLGMAIVKRAVDTLGGLISFESQVGIGTTFVVRLPLTSLGTD